MFNNRRYINELKSKIDFLEKDIESKENSVSNLLDANMEFAVENEYLRKRIDTLEKVLEKKELIVCELNIKLCRAEGQLDKVINLVRMQFDVDLTNLLEGRKINEK